MWWLRFLLVFSFLFSAISADCPSCIKQNNHWCVDSNSCLTTTGGPCNITIKDVLNCPMYPKPGYEYTDDFGRYTAMPIIVAAGLGDPMICLKNAMPTLVLDKLVNAPCSSYGQNTSCQAYTAYDTIKKVIFISFRGTDGSVQLEEEIESLLSKKEPFFDSGHVFKFFYDAFQMLWAEGIESSVRSLKYLYPDYDVWVFGHSLGGALASVCSSYIAKVGLSTPEKTRLVTFGQPRTGDRDYAQWHDSWFLYSYRIFNHKDLIPRVPPLGGPDEVWHHRFEIWYNNRMAVGDPWQLCAEGDGHYCANAQPDAITVDHMTYFDKNMYKWGGKGCLK